jgi:nitric oxide reductase subunit C
VPDYTVINQRIDYRFDETRNMKVPVIGAAMPLFGTVLSAEDARALVDLGKVTTQAKNCMNCHTLLGNGAYYAPDLTKSWLDPAWGNEASRETMMLNFLLDPNRYARTYGTNRRMPNLRITEPEARGIIAFLKWMSSIDTNGFPAGFVPIKQGD